MMVGNSIPTSRPSSGDPEKARELSAQYNVPAFPYEEYDDLLRSGKVDAVYVAVPNALHREYTERAAKVGVHVLCEKPMADTAKDCKAMIKACHKNDVKLMVAYRLHFEEGNLRAIEALESGKIGEPRVFDSVFTQQVEGGNTRLDEDLGGSPLLDIGIYCINAARYLFRAEPTEVMAFAASRDQERFREVPVYVVSTNSAKADLERAMKLGATRYFVKPFDVEALGRAVREALES